MFHLSKAGSEHRYSGGDLPTPGYDCAAIEALRDSRPDAARAAGPMSYYRSVTKELE